MRYPGGSDDRKSRDRLQAGEASKGCLIGTAALPNGAMSLCNLSWLGFMPADEGRYAEQAAAAWWFKAAEQSVLRSMTPKGEGNEI
jgi:hypothetical protein